jgi:hypothetical protein
MKTSKTGRSLSACLLALVALPALAFSQDDELTQDVITRGALNAADAPQQRIIDELNIKNVT